MSKLIDLSGQAFGRLTVIGRADNDSNGRATWECLCECGNITTVAGKSLRSGLTSSCGCLQREAAAKTGNTSTHGQSKRGQQHYSEYRSWSCMKRRCSDPANKGYYGKGVNVCKEWINSFESFLRDMGPKPSPNHTIDRIDSEGDYTPRNCRWASKQTQSSNRSHLKNARLISPSGVRHVIKAGYVGMFCRETGLCKTSIRTVLRKSRKSYKGWTGQYI